MNLSKIFNKTIGGEYNSISPISVSFGSLDVTASENLSDSQVFNQIYCKGLKAKISCFFLFISNSPEP